MPKHFELRKIGPESSIPSKSTTPVVGDSLYRLVFMTSGQANLCIDVEHFAIASSFVIFIRPGQSYRIDDCQALEGYELSFNEWYLGMDEENIESFYSGNLLAFFSDQVIKLETETCHDICETLERMLKEQHRVKTFQKELLKRYFRILLTYLGRQFDENGPGRSQGGSVDCVKRFLSLVDRNFKERKMVCEYATELCMTPNYLNQIVKKITAHSAGYHIRQRVVLEAQRKAIYSNQTMKEIAYSLGFSDIAHFSKMFKRVAGVNFVNFKKDKLTLPYVYAIAI